MDTWTYVRIKAEKNAAMERVEVRLSWQRPVCLQRRSAAASGRSRCCPFASTTCSRAPHRWPPPYEQQKQHKDEEWREKIDNWRERTASSPRTLPWSEPYLMNLMPPAPVEMLPPIWQLPLAPRSRGTIRDSFAALSCSCSSTHPASASITPVRGLRDITLLRSDRESITSS